MQSQELPQGAQEIIDEGLAGFGSDEKLTQAKEYLDDGKYDAAFDEVSRVLMILQPELETSRRARNEAARGYTLRADIRVALKHTEDLILADLLAAAELGSISGYIGAARLEFRLNSDVNSDSTEIPHSSFERAEANIRAAADLGNLYAASKLEMMARSRGDLVERSYWQFITKINSNRELSVDRFEEIKNLLTEPIIQVMRSGINLYGLTGESVETLNNLPGRSVFTIYQLDHFLRLRFEFTLRSFYKDNHEGNVHTVLDSYQAGQSVIGDGVVTDLYLLVPGVSREQLPKQVTIPRQDIAKFISAGDEIAVRCGSDDHQASVWRVDRDAGLVYLLDPFYEYWSPEQTPCTPSFRLNQYKYRRHLVSINLDELSPTVLAIFTLRDAQNKD